ncbi:MAG TPA: THUMP domain-containing protein [Burkholderiaceae bacterium]|nr:THUMP domain-containing protein [Burkholderiaceae bacterium]HQR68981.1 THUMP domain-containing protein [Burkholderiaceae bacterium]
MTTRLHTYFAVCPRGLEPALADELEAHGAQSAKPESGGVAFAGPVEVGYAANLHSRLASRILWQVGRRGYSNEQHLYDATQEIRWQDLMSPQQTLRVDVTASRSPLTSLEFAMLRIKDGIVDRLRTLTGTRPSIDRQNPDVRVFAYLDQRTVTLYVDLSGEPLFKRGWRADKGEAPLKENLAAGLLTLAGWTPDVPLLDPFCGSGTIVIEAATIATRRAPGLNRSFAFERLASFDRRAWQRQLARAQAAVDDSAQAIVVGSDISTRVIEQARTNAGLAGLGSLLADGRLRLSAGDARTVQPPAEHGMIISNPPYGEQSAPRSSTVPKMMGEVGDRLKSAFAGWHAWFLTSDRQLPRQMRLAETRKPVLYNGALECRFFRFEMVGGRYSPRGGTPIRSFDAD